MNTNNEDGKYVYVVTVFGCNSSYNHMWTPTNTVYKSYADAWAEYCKRRPEMKSDYTFIEETGKYKCGDRSLSTLDDVMVCDEYKYGDYCEARIETDGYGHQHYRHGDGNYAKRPEGASIRRVLVNRSSSRIGGSESSEEREEGDLWVVCHFGCHSAHNSLWVPKTFVYTSKTLAYCKYKSIRPEMEEDFKEDPEKDFKHILDLAECSETIREDGSERIQRGGWGDYEHAWEVKDWGGGYRIKQRADPDIKHDNDIRNLAKTPFGALVKLTHLK